MDAGDLPKRQEITFKYLVIPSLHYIHGHHIPVTQYTECNRRNGPDFRRVFLMLNYTDKPQNTYIQSSMVTEI